jgi:hypothetical protein
MGANLAQPNWRVTPCLCGKISDLSPTAESAAPNIWVGAIGTCFWLWRRSVPSDPRLTFDIGNRDFGRWVKIRKIEKLVLNFVLRISEPTPSFPLTGTARYESEGVGMQRVQRPSGQRRCTQQRRRNALGRSPLGWRSSTSPALVGPS